jgi:acyl-CoA dehydrogenase
VMAICVRPNMELASTGVWDTLGLRGTCSRPGRLTADVPAELVITGYADIFVQTSLPVSLVLLGSVWMGIAEAAARRAHSSVRAQARKSRAAASAGNAPAAQSMGAFRLAELSTVLYQMRDVLAMAALEYERVKGTPEVESLQFTARMDTLKLSASAFVLDIVLRSMAICGLPGYMNGSPSSMARLVRDALAAPLMINNDRSLQASAQTMLIRKEL